MSKTTDHNVTTRRRPEPLDVRRLRADFPILRQRVHGKPLVYLDTTASAQKPRSVVDALDRFYLTQSSNVHRGLPSFTPLPWTCCVPLPKRKVSRRPVPAAFCSAMTGTAASP